MPRFLHFYLLLGLCMMLFNNAAYAQDCTPTPPTGLAVSNITDNSATLSWDAVPGVESYRLWVGGDIGIIHTNSSATSYTLTGLQPGYRYDWTVLSICSNLASEWAYGPSFVTTGGCTPTPPTGLAVSNITDNSATLSWDAVPGVESYRLWVGGDIGIIHTNSSATSYTLTGLQPGYRYSWSVLSLCSNLYSEWAHGPSFVTINSGANTAARDNNRLEAATDTETIQTNQLMLYPNPSVDEVNISLSGNETITAMYIFNMQGAQVKRVENINSSFETIGLKDYGAGMYLVKVVINNEYTLIKKVIIK